MCGITGWLLPPGAELSPAVLDRLSESIRHRGPDDAGQYCNPAAGLALAQRRLSIIDLSPGGHQPMIHADTGDVLVFNGEIYNFRELRTQLEYQGCRFRSSSDTEVLLQGLAVWGLRSCLKRLRGMYAFAWWQAAECALHLARDPLGIKPLYYGEPLCGAGFVFASEIKAFLSLPGFARQVDRRALGQFLEFGYTFEAERTIFAGIHKLPPGHLLTVRAGVAGLLERFFTPEVRVDESRTSEDWQEELYATLCQVVAEHLIADVPVGLLLSGGLDSSLVAALAVRSVPVRTVCMGFADSAVDERPHAREVARFIGAEHEEVLIKPGEIQNMLEGAAVDFDDLFADWGTISTRLLYQKCWERGIKVVIVGEGSDELFGGYGVFRRSQSRAPRDWWLFQLYRNYCGRRYGHYFGAFRARMRAYLDATGDDRFAAIRLFESREQLPNNYVMKVDKASMAASVEARTPFLDQRVAEIAYRIPARHLLSAESEKEVLRRMAGRYRLLPEATLCRRKFGASIVASWMDESESFRCYARDIILAPGGWTEALGLDGAMRDYFLRGRNGYPFPWAISIFSNLAWRLLTLELWARVYEIAARDA
ncbi:MAG TPA: asparagine synthase (glutamine-hydrolyzing) [Candidatus Competibacter sp.]|nr:asparagine synthase (glutamine-hydrolyzing) [Candidatus Competibacteraceae bacterium]HRW64688.1 asparagine synthase (glutamine-hydrolyzing) [Candidatus Competibacter sp.]